MAKRCIIELDIDPKSTEMEFDTFRAFVNDSCIPVMWERMSEAKSRFDQIDPILTGEMRDGSVDVKCETDFKGDTKCSGSLSISW